MPKRADLHLHTRFSRWKHLRIIKPRDSYTDPLDAYERCKALGMDYIAITDHDTIDGALDLLSKRPELEPEVIVGEEVETYFPDTGQWIHVNVFDLDERTHDEISRLRPNVRELLPYLRQRRLLHVLNHPFQSYRGQKPPMRFIDEILSMFEHFEIGNGNLSVRHNRAVAEMLDLAAVHHRRKHAVGGSDAHHLRDIGLFWTEAPVRDESGDGGKRAWLAALARGEGIVTGRSVGALGLAANVYRTIGRYYLSLLSPEVRREMRAENFAAAAAFVPVCISGVPLLLSLGHSLRLEIATLSIRRAVEKMRAVEIKAPPAAELLEDPLD